MSSAPSPPEMEDPSASAAGVDLLDGPVCEKCAHPLETEQTTACPHCGWYASVGTYVDISREWETAISGQADDAQAEPSPLKVFLKLIPAWCWAAWGCGVGAVALSVLARVLIQDEALRSTWSVSQLFAGVGGGFVCHVAAFVLMSTGDPEMGLGDMVVSPLRGWKKLFSQLPRYQWVVCLNTFSMTTAVGAMFIIGGIPYERVWDWGIKPPAKKNLVDAIASQAAAGGGEQDMEEAMAAFAQDAAVKGAGGKGLAKPAAGEATELVRKTIDALIIGYQLDANGAISTFFIAAEVNGSLIYAGRVSPTLSPDESVKFVERLRAARALRPFVTAPDEAEWVQPRFTCRVSYDKRVESGRLQGLLWEDMLGEVKLPW